MKTMKTIGLLGGMSWESTLIYYRAINEAVKNALGGLHSAQIVLYSVDFQTVAQLQSAGDWGGAARLLVNASQNIQAAGADILLICTNTMHKVAPDIEQAVQIPLLHIADAAAEELASKGVKTIGLLGTCFTMEQAFYKDRLAHKHGIHTIVPEQADRQTVHNVIFDELCLGKIKLASKIAYLQVIERLHAQGAEAIILGCTEIGMLINQDDTHVKLLDAAAIHAKKAVEYALSP